VAKIVITAAEKGIRLLPFIKEMPKEMMPGKRE
jgi:UTP-glucose-1-phosphate uridylyltransferase